MGQPGDSGSFRTKRFTRGELTAAGMGLAGGVLLGSVMLLGGGPRAPERATPKSAVSRTEPATTAPVESRARTVGITDAERRRLSQVEAELEALETSGASADQEPNVSSGETILPEAQPAPAQPARPSRTGSPSATHEASTGKATLAYWNALNDVIAREAAMRVAPANLTAANAGGFVEARVRAGKFASESMRQLDRQGVDRDVLTHADALMAWYADEAKLAGQASSLLGSSDIAARKGSAGKSWRTSEEQHRQRCDEINRRSQALQSQMSQKYGLSFPALN